MKNSLRKLRGFGLHKQADAKDRRDPRFLAQLDELAQASEDLQNMRDCYDTLFSAAAATANSAYEFSESLQDMGACLLEKTALNDDEDSGKVLLKLGKVQFELQKLVDSYRSHIFKTITTPSESLLNELRTVEEMKQQCDEKRNVYERMVSQREKGRSKIGKEETFSKEQLQAAHDEYDEEATLFVFRLKSLKQGQSRSLLTQAARHHAAQLCFFKKALKSLEAVEPHVKTITEQYHIDYQFSGLEDDDGEDADDDDYFDTHDEGELSFDYGEKGQEIDAVSTSQNAMELDQADITFPTVAPVMTAKENLQRSYWESHSFRTDIRTSSQSAPLFAENKSDNTDKRKPIRLSSSRRFSTYVLPTPGGTKSPSNTGSGSPLSQTLRTSESARTHSLWHSSPLDGKKLDKILEEEKLSRSITQSVLRESNNNISATGLPPPLADGLLISRLDPHGASDSKKIKRQAFSGPLTSKPWPTKPFSKEHSRLFSVPIQRPRSASPKVSPCPSPPLMSSPKISELHELPRPPASPSLKSSRPIGYVGHSAPLLPKCQFQTTRNESAKRRTSASPLPTPPQAITRSFSIPSSNNLNEVVETSKPMETSPSSALVSPPLTPISLPKPSRGSTTVQIVEIRDTD